mmetsp:Transcript_2668/g.3999  ORF Transcript_2668/g.3999 Transcript_2668/m.3999 type:complete len:392 (+) Transcript_2668:98-1273(+)
MDDPNDMSVTDLLQSMSQSLLEVKTVHRPVDVPDRPFNLKIGGKPPREMFYRKTIVCAADPTVPYKPERCSCQYLCSRALATTKCLTCALYDPQGLGYYCDACFTSRHPWYRVTHVFAPIYRNESIRDSMRKQDSQLQADRRRVEGYEMLSKLKENEFKLSVVADDLEVDTNMRSAARKSVALESRMVALRRKLRSSVRASGGVMEITEDEAAVSVQRAYRGYQIRRLVSLAYAERTVRVWDESSGREYYYDKFLETSSWTPSNLLMKKDLESLPLVHEQDPERRIWCVKKTMARRRALPIVSEDEAASVITAFFRCIVARSVVLRTASIVYKKVYDADYDTHFYANVLTGESTWEKPRLFLTSDALLLLTDDQNKRSPRVNRERIQIANN